VRQPRAPFVIAVVVSMTACGGGGSTTSPTSVPSPTTVSSVTVVSGESLQPVAGARVVVGGQQVTTDAQGRAGFSATAPATPVDVLAAGHLDSQSQLDRRDANGRLTLWPQTSPTGLDPDFTRELVYTGSDQGLQPEGTGVFLRRWPASVTQVQIVVQGPADGAYETMDPTAVAVLGRAAAEIGAATGGALVYNAPVFTGSSRPGFLHVRIQPGSPRCSGDGAAFWDLPNAVGEGGTVTFCGASGPRDFQFVVHLLGHTYGLNHTSGPQDVMYQGNRRVETFSARERLAMQLMLQRPRGTRFPDNDRQALAQSEGGRTFSCR
jgi:hypothetical protein